MESVPDTASLVYKHPSWTETKEYDPDAFYVWPTKGDWVTFKGKRFEVDRIEFVHDEYDILRELAVHLKDVHIPTTRETQMIIDNGNCRTRYF